MMLFSKSYKLPDTPGNLSRAAVIAALAAASLLLIPLIAMQFSDEVKWSLFDFIAAWVLLFGAGFTYKLVSGRTHNIAYRAAIGLAVATALFLVWSNLAVGLIGSENNPANLMYGGVLAVAVIGSLIARFQPNGMMRALLTTALAQVLVAVIALLAGHGYTSGLIQEIILVNGFFVVLWVGSALLFQYAAKKRPLSL